MAGGRKRKRGFGETLPCSLILGAKTLEFPNVFQPEPSLSDLRDSSYSLQYQDQSWRWVVVVPASYHFRLILVAMAYRYPLRHDSAA